VPEPGLEAAAMRNKAPQQRRGSAAASLAVFAYGSLVSRASASLTLGRQVESVELAELEGWARRWTVARDNRASEKCFGRADGTLPSFCLGLNLDPDPAAVPPNGVLIEVTEAELERLDGRELRYARAEVTDAVRARTGAHRFERVVAYRARPEHHRPEPPGDAIVIASYPRAIEAAFAEYGPAELEAYRASTAPPPVEVIEAMPIEDRIPPGNPREW
jgi:cation transport regulator ChaC